MKMSVLLIVGFWNIEILLIFSLLSVSCGNRFHPRAQVCTGNALRFPLSAAPWPQHLWATQEASLCICRANRGDSRRWQSPMRRMEGREEEGGVCPHASLLLSNRKEIHHNQTSLLCSETFEQD